MALASSVSLPPLSGAKLKSRFTQRIIGKDQVGLSLEAARLRLREFCGKLEALLGDWRPTPFVDALAQDFDGYLASQS